MEKTVKERLIKFIKSQNMTNKKFENSIGVSNGFVSNISKGIGADKLHKISLTYPHLNVDWLLYGEGSMLKEDLPVINYSVGTPYYDVDFMLGFDHLYAPTSESPEYLINIPRYNKATLWCNASGHSMEPEINNGDIVALQKIDDIRFLPFGEIYAIITTNDMRTIKRIGRGDTPDTYKLIPTNNNFPAQDIPIDMILHVYKVLGCIKRF